MKKMGVLFMSLVLGAVCLTGCANHEEAFTQKSYTTDAEQITEVCIDVRDRQIEVVRSSNELSRTF